MNPTPIARAALALRGLSVGDAFGDQFFLAAATVEERIATRTLPAAPWRWTDDTAMSLAIFEVLTTHESIAQDALAAAFADGYQRDMARGYGGAAHRVLQDIHAGVGWADAARRGYGGEGSMGNGAAMRAAPVGAFFSNDYAEVRRQAIWSAEPTHAHPEGQAGAVAVAIAAAFVAQAALGQERLSSDELFGRVIAFTPAGATLQAIKKASTLPSTYDVRTAVAALGNGTTFLASDTVPFALWCAAAHLDDFEAALWKTVSGLGDRDTTCAIVGAIVALAVGEPGIPSSFLANTEPLVWPIPKGEQLEIDNG
jgi:ADP-ribosylglycohydrolase